MHRVEPSSDISASEIETIARMPGQLCGMKMNGDLVVNNKGTGKTLWWKTMPGIEEWENRVKFNCTAVFR